MVAANAALKGPSATGPFSLYFKKISTLTQAFFRKKKGFVSPIRP